MFRSLAAVSLAAATVLLSACGPSVSAQATCKLAVHLDSGAERRFNSAVKAFAGANGFNASVFGESAGAVLLFSGKPAIRAFPAVGADLKPLGDDPGNRVLFLYGVRETYPAGKVIEAASLFSTRLNAIAGVKVGPIDAIQRPPFDDNGSSCVQQEIE